jgi:3'-phosphoadenosine 5'-phosphosulfate sulfotransferase (PAPS reductase)/FAD synthetase
MRYEVLSSTGKDSEAAMWWAYHNLPFEDWGIIFSDLDWDHKDVYKYLEYLESRVGKKFKKIKSESFRDKITQEVKERIFEIFGATNVFAEMIMYRSRFPSTKARFCTEDLKVKPVIDYILDHCHYDLTLIQGVRAEESQARRNLSPTDDYFKFYLEPYGYDAKGNPKFHTYRKKDVLAHIEKYEVTVFRPILKLTHNEVFNIIFENDSPGNPLYRAGMSRVGCFPCIMCRLSEIRQIALYDQDVIEKIYQLELLSNSTFFPPNYIPNKYCTKVAFIRVYREDLIKLFGAKVKKKNKNAPQAEISLFDMEVINPEARLYEMYFKNDKIPVLLDEDEEEYIIRRVKVPTIKDVVTYVLANPDQTDFLNGAPGCVSVYNICESPNA